MTQPIQHASTVVLLRQRQGAVEVFVVQRHSRSPFMPDAYVYPGGKLDPEDCAPEASQLCTGLRPEQALARLAPQGPRLPEDEALSPAQALGLHLAALREVFEEVGVLLARRADGGPLPWGDPGFGARMAQARRRLHQQQLSMAELGRQEGLRFPLDALDYFAQWITPDIEPRRFNARFFLALAPEDQEPVHDDLETVASGWMRPRQVIERYYAGDLLLTPPTLCTLEDLSGFSSPAALRRALLARPVVTVLPRPHTPPDGSLGLALPGDKLYPATPGLTGTTYLERRDGRWWPQKSN